MGAELLPGSRVIVAKKRARRPKCHYCGSPHGRAVGRDLFCDTCRKTYNHYSWAGMMDPCQVCPRCAGALRTARTLAFNPPRSSDAQHIANCEEGPGPDCDRCNRIVAERRELERAGVSWRDPRVITQGPFRERNPLTREDAHRMLAAGGFRARDGRWRPLTQKQIKYFALVASGRIRATNPPTDGELDDSFNFGQNVIPLAVPELAADDAAALETTVGTLLKDPQEKAVLQVAVRAFGKDQPFTRRQLAGESEVILRGRRGGRLSLGAREVITSKALGKFIELDYARPVGPGPRGGLRGPERFLITEFGYAAAYGDSVQAVEQDAQSIVDRQIAQLEAKPVRAKPGEGPVYRPVIKRVGGRGHKLPRRTMERIIAQGYRVRYNPMTGETMPALHERGVAVCSTCKGWVPDTAFAEPMVCPKHPNARVISVMMPRRRGAKAWPVRGRAHYNPPLTSIQGMRSGYQRIQLNSGLPPAQFNRLAKAELAGKANPKPFQWFLAAISVAKKFSPARQECGCNRGLYDHPGAPAHKGEMCYFCQGKGWFGPDDIVRNGWHAAYSQQNHEERMKAEGRS